MRRFFQNDSEAGTGSREAHIIELPYLEENQPLKIKLDHNDENLKELIVHKCDNLPKALELFESSSTEAAMEDTENVSLIKFEISEHFPDLNSTELHGLSIKCIKKSIVIFFASQSGQKFSIYWKSNEIDKFMTFKSYDSYFMRTNRILFEFLAKFLTKSLRNKHLGLRKLDSKHESTEFELHFLADHREYNILLVAAEMGDVAVVEILMKLDVSTDSPFKNINAQTLAYQNQHFHVLLMLLQKSLTFPVRMDVKKCSAEVQNFASMSSNFHELIEANDVAKVTELVQENSHLTYFYNESNESAPKVALRSNRPEVYEALLVNDIKFGPHEKVEAIMEELEYETRRAVREIHFRNSKDMSESHLNVLMSNSSVSHDVFNPKEMTSQVQNAFNILNTIPLIRIILMVVAASKKFKIIFDFNRDTVQFVDPTSDGYTNGIFYLSGRIFIGAKQLLDKATRNLALATIAHELCHYAINLTYGNDAKPYAPNDNQRKQEFENISKYCKENQEKEEVIELVYGCYNEDMHHAELAVRVAHLMAHYHGQPEKLQQSRENFNGLFTFVEEKLAPEMTKAIPDIESKFDKEIEKKDKQISKLWKFLYLAIIFGVILAALVGFYFYKPTYKFGELSEKQQLNVKNGNVLYKNINVKLSDLFPRNSMVYYNLTSDHISKLLGKEILNFDDPLLHYLDKQVVFDWGSLAEKLKKKVLGSNLNFQGQILKFMDIENLYPDTLMSLTSDQIKTILNGTEIEVGEKVKSEVDFYVERKFILEDSMNMYLEYAYGHNFIFNDFTHAQNIKNRTSVKTFETFVDEFLNKSFDDRFEILYKVRESREFKNRYIHVKTNFHFMHKNSSQILKQLKNDRILILSSEAGAGKTVTFEELSVKMKEKFPTNWVSYIDLRKYTKLFNKNGIVENVEELIEAILNLSLKNEFEKEIFKKSFESGNVALFWNGFDEISPTYSEFVLNVLKLIQQHFRNVQFVCTRPLYSNQLSKSLKTPSWKLVSFDENEKRYFLEKFFESRKVSSEIVDEIIKNVQEVVRKLRYENDDLYNFNTPLMLTLVAEVYEDGNGTKSVNTYQIYDKFVNKRIKIWLVSNSDDDSSKVQYVENVAKIFQKYALYEHHLYFYSSILELKMRKLQIMQTNLAKGLSSEEISSIGILYINGKKDFGFAHGTFSEFFVAKYFIDNIYNADESMENDEVELRLEMFFTLMQAHGRHQTIITFFISSFLDTENVKENFSEKITEMLRTKFKNFFIRLLKMSYPEIFEFLFKFFQKDHNLLVDLLHVDQDETFYTAIFNPNYLAQVTNPEEIKSLARNFLTDDEFQKFLSGKNQKGKILYGMHFYGLIGMKKVNDHYDTELEALNGSSFWEFFNETQENLTVVEQKELFVTAASPIIYMFYDEFFNLSDNSNDLLGYKKLWTNFEHLLSPMEMQNALGEAFLQYFETAESFHNEQIFFLNFLLEKADKFLTNIQIYNIFYNKNILHEAHSSFDLSDFKILWPFLSNRTNKEQRRKILLKDDCDENYFEYGYIHHRPKSYSFRASKTRLYEFTPFKIIHRYMINRFTIIHNYTRQIYNEHFDKTELRKMILDSNDLILYAVGLQHDTKKFMLYLEDFFEGFEKTLKGYLDRKIKPTGLSIFKFVESTKEYRHSDAHKSWFVRLKAFTDLYNKLN